MKKNLDPPRWLVKLPFKIARNARRSSLSTANTAHKIIMQTVYLGNMMRPVQYGSRQGCTIGTLHKVSLSGRWHYDRRRVRVRGAHECSIGCKKNNGFRRGDVYRVSNWSRITS